MPHEHLASPPPAAAPSSDSLLRPTRSRLGRLLGVRVVSMGSYVAERVVRNADLAALGYDAEWILQRTGIRERRHAPADVATSDLAVEAARRCIARAGISPDDIDLLLLGTYTPDLLMPATASLVQDRLGLRVLAMDLQAACASFVFALLSGMQFIATGCSKLALIIGADCNTRVLNPADQRTYPLFGDAAGAVLLAAGRPDQGLLGYAVGSDGAGTDLLCRPMGGARRPCTPQGVAAGEHFLAMEGRPVFKWAVRMLRDSVAETLTAADLTLNQIDLFIFHQANLRIINSAVDDLKIDPAKVINNVDRYGNTAAASIPLALDEAHQQGRIGPGSRVLFSGFGGGLAWGTAVMQW